MLKRKTIRAKDLYYIAYCIVTISFVLGETVLIENGILNLAIIVIRYVGCGFVFAKCIFTFSSRNKMNFKSLLWISVIIIIWGLMFYTTGSDNTFLILLIFMILSYDVEQEKILRIYSLSVFACLSVMIVLAMLGVVQNIESITSVKVRYGLGFGYVTFASNFFFHVVLTFFSYKRNNFKYKTLLFLYIVNYFFFYQTKTRAVFYLTTAVLMIYTLIKIFNINKIPSNRFLRLVLIWIMPICALFAVGFQNYYNKNFDSPIMMATNVILSNRLALAKIGIEKYGYSLLGKKVTWITVTTKNMKSFSDYFYIDSSYIQTAVIYGLVMLTAVCVGFIILQYYNVQNNNLWIVIAITAFSIHCITDPQLMSIKYDAYLLLVLPAIRQKRAVGHTTN